MCASSGSAASGTHLSWIWLGSRRRTKRGLEGSVSTAIAAGLSDGGSRAGRDQAPRVGELETGRLARLADGDRGARREARFGEERRQPHADLSPQWPLEGAGRHAAAEICARQPVPTELRMREEEIHGFPRRRSVMATMTDPLVVQTPHHHSPCSHCDVFARRPVAARTSSIGSRSLRLRQPSQKGVLLCSDRKSQTRWSASGSSEIHRSRASESAWKSAEGDLRRRRDGFTVSATGRQLGPRNETARTNAANALGISLPRTYTCSAGKAFPENVPIGLEKLPRQPRG